MRQTQVMIFQGQKVTASVQKNAENLRTMIHTDATIKLLKNVQGSPAYCQQVLYDDLAMMRQLGNATWFLTVSSKHAVARNHRALLVNLAISTAMPLEEKSRWWQTDPVSTA